MGIQANLGTWLWAVARWRWRTLGWALALATVLCFWARLSAADTGELRPSHVYQSLQTLRFELEAIRAEMGRPRLAESNLRVRFASPWEVHSQAQAVFDKSARLAREFSHEQGVRPPRPKGEPRPADVYNLVEAARSHIAAIGRALGIEPQSSTPALDKSRTPADVFLSLLQASRQLNLILSHPIESRDVFEQVSLSIAYARALARSLGLSSLPEVPQLVSKKMPLDVFRRLLDCQEQLRRLAQKRGARSLQVSRTKPHFGTIVTGDVYDESVLLVSQILRLRSQLGFVKHLRRHKYPGRIFSSHVFQQVEHLHSILSSIAVQEVNSPPLSTSTGSQ